MEEKEPKKKSALSKEEKKLRATANRILKRRQEQRALEDELAEIKEIKELLQSEPETKTPTPRADPESACQIPPAAPGLSLIQPALFGWLFTETGLDLKRFVTSGQTLFGQPVTQLTQPLFEKLLLHRSFELRSDSVSGGVSLFVVHLMAASTDRELVAACSDFLKRFPVAMTTSDVLPLLANMGATSQSLWGEEFHLQVCTYLVSDGKGRPDFPAYNIEKLMQYLSFCVEEMLLPCDASSEPLVVALSQFALDRNIRGRPLLSGLTTLLSLIAQRCAETQGCDTVAEWLLRPHHHPLNLMEVCRLAVRSDLSLHRALLRRTLGTLLNVKLTLHLPVTARDVRMVVRACKSSSFAPLPAYSALLLLKTVVPHLSVTSKEVELIGKDLQALEMGFGSLPEMADSVRLRAACAQLRGLIMVAAVSQNITHQMEADLNDEF